MDIARRAVSGEITPQQAFSQIESLLMRQTGLDGLLSGGQPGNPQPTDQGAGTYTVKPGDNLTKIAAANGTTWQEIARVNGLSDPNMILPDQVLRMPTGAGGATQYTVRAGDTVSALAQRNGTTVAAIAQASGLANPDRIDVGQQLTIPRGTGGNGGVPVASGQNPGAPGVTQQNPAALPAGATANGQINLDSFLNSSQGSRALGAVIIGNAEGTRTPSGATTRAYGGHIDPGNSAANVGSFSLQNAGGRGPEAADRTQLSRLAAQRPAYEAAARRAGLDPNNATLATAYFDLYNQSPKAAGRFLDQIGRLSQTGISQQSVTQLRVDSFINPATGVRYQGAAGGFVNIARDRNGGREPTAAEIRDVVMADQSRRQRAMVSAMDAQGVNRGEVQGAATPPPARPDATGGVRPDAGPTRPGQFVNPTGQGIRNDSGGEGHFGASRGSRAHRGLDISSTPGQDVRAPISGVLTAARPSASQPFGGFRITADDGTVVKVFYAQVNPGMLGQRVNAGDSVARAQDLQMPGGYSRSVGDHVHVEVWQNGRARDPQPFFFR